MKSKENRAVTRCYQNGISVTRKEFREAVRAYNNFEMPLSKRIIMIAREWDPDFFPFLKEYLKSRSIV